MNEGMNKVYLLGHLGADPELRQTSTGGVLKMRLATNTSWFDKEKNQWQERLEWHSVVVFGKRGEGLSRILTKGFKILVVGRMSTSSYDKDGQKHYKTEVIAQDVFLAGGPRDRASQQQMNGAMPHANDVAGGLTELPF